MIQKKSFFKAIDRWFSPPKKSFFLFGPRGTGKSTWILHHYPNAKFLNLLEPDTLRHYSAFPENFEVYVRAHPTVKTFIIDEVQNAPMLLSVVHKLIEEKQDWQFILTGSSSRKLKRSGVDLLAGRAQLKTLHPFMATELKEDFYLDKALNLGLIPLIVTSTEPEEDLRAYVALYMKEEVQMEGLIRNQAHFYRFLELISFSQASVLNYSNIARDCGISSKTVEQYVTILEDLLLSIRLPVFSKKALRHITSRPKFYFFDVGVYNSIRPKGPLDNPEAIGGHALETLVLQHLRAWIDYSKESGQLFFWQTKSGLEVDFIIYGDIGFYAIEVKRSARIRPQDLRGLKEFQKDYPQATCILLHQGKETMQIQNILCHSVTHFLKNLFPNQRLG